MGKKKIYKKDFISVTSAMIKEYTVRRIIEKHGLFKISNY